MPRSTLHTPRRLARYLVAAAMLCTTATATSCDCTDEEKAAAKRALVGLAMIDCYEKTWGLKLKSPALEYNDEAGIWVSVAYIGDQVHVLRWANDGECQAQASTFHVRPEGTVRCLVIGIDRNYVSVGEDFDTEWAAAQAAINAQHQTFASAAGLSGPILQFENTNVVVSTREIANIDPRDRSAFSAQLTALGHDLAAYDQIIVMDLDPHNSNGGINYGDYSVVNWFWLELQGQVDIPPDQWMGFARTAYHHEVGHAHGWDHDWGGDPSSGFITHPQFFGWTDLDGDGIVEILDPNPYGT